MKKAIFVLFISIFLNACSKKKEEKFTYTVEHKNQESLTCIKNIDLFKNFEFDDFNNLYLNKTKKLKFKKLDNNLKVNYLLNVLIFERDVYMDKDWIKYDIKSYLISKQCKIGNFQPILIQNYGTDHSSLAWIILNDKNQKVTGIQISGGEKAGPEVQEDTVIISSPLERCIFKNDKVIKISKVYSFNPQQPNNPVDIDSVVYEYTFDKVKTIKTKIIFDTTFSRIIDIDTLKMY